MLLMSDAPALRKRQAVSQAVADQCLSEMAQGSSDALARLYEITRTTVYAFALSLLKHGPDAEDVVQETYIRAFLAAGSYRTNGTPLAWLLAIARNLALMKLRERGKIQDVSEEDWASFALDSPAITSDDRLVLTAALRVLTEEERQIVLLHAVTGLKHREIAGLLQLPLSTVLSKYHRSLKKLRTTLEGGDSHG